MVLYRYRCRKIPILAVSIFLLTISTALAPVAGRNIAAIIASGTRVAVEVMPADPTRIDVLDGVGRPRAEGTDSCHCEF